MFRVAKALLPVSCPVNATAPGKLRFPSVCKMTTVAIKLKSVFPADSGSRLGGGVAWLRRLRSRWACCAQQCCSCFPVRAPPAPELRLDSQRGMASLTSRLGEVIVLIRHTWNVAIRSAGPCLDAPDGITVAGKNLAVERGLPLPVSGSGAPISSRAIPAPADLVAPVQGGVAGLAWLAECRPLHRMFWLLESRRGEISFWSRTATASRSKDIGLAVEEPPYGGMFPDVCRRRRPQPVATGTITAETLLLRTSVAARWAVACQPGRRCRARTYRLLAVTVVVGALLFPGDAWAAATFWLSERQRQRGGAMPGEQRVCRRRLAAAAAGRRTHRPDRISSVTPCRFSPAPGQLFASFIQFAMAVRSRSGCSITCAVLLGAAGALR